MASQKDIKRRIRSVKSTRQITRTMNMVAAAKLRRAQECIYSARPYAFAVREVLETLLAHDRTLQHPLLAQPEGECWLLVVLGGDRGLCGSFNQNVIRRCDQYIKQHADRRFVIWLMGRKVINQYRRRGHHMVNEFADFHDRFSETMLAAFLRHLESSFHDTDKRQTIYTFPYLVEDFSLKMIDRFRHLLTRPFETGILHKVVFIYNRFISAMQQELVEETFLPITVAGTRSLNFHHLYEPDGEEVLRQLMPRHIRSQLFRIQLESRASEFGARMTAMEQATRNAEKMMDTLTLAYNRARQSAITTEILEIVSGAEALRGRE